MDIRRFLFDTDKLDEDLITLLSIFNARVANHKCAAGISWLFAIEENIIQKTLISTASTLRMIDDRFIGNSKQIKFHFPHVGKLEIEQTTVPLTFREACNKILHSDELLLSKKESIDNQKDFLDFSIIIKGKKALKKWTAFIEIDKYVVNGLNLSDSYDSNWDLSTR